MFLFSTIYLSYPHYFHLLFCNFVLYNLSFTYIKQSWDWWMTGWDLRFVFFFCPFTSGADNIVELTVFHYCARIFLKFFFSSFCLFPILSLSPQNKLNIVLLEMDYYIIIQRSLLCKRTLVCLWGSYGNPEIFKVVEKQNNQPFFTDFLFYYHLFPRVTLR